MGLKNLTVLFLVFLLICSASANRRREAGTLADTTDACLLAKEICDYAWDTRREYDAMPDTTEELKRQKREFLQALNSSIIQCERHKKECAKSVRR